MTRQLIVLFGPGAAKSREIIAAADGFEVTFAIRSDAREAPALLRSLPRSTRALVYDRAETLVDKLVGRHVDGVLTFAEEYVLDAVRIADCLGVPSAGLNAAQILCSKIQQRRVFTEANMPQPKFAELPSMYGCSQVWDKLGRRPLVLKPDSGAGSRNTFVANTLGEFRAIANAARTSVRRYVVESYMPCAPQSWPFAGDYASVETVSIAGRHYPLTVTGRFPILESLREAGGFHPAVHLDDRTIAELKRVAETALLAIGFLNGVTHCEIKLTEGGPVVIELNGRLGGNVHSLVMASSGVSFVRLAVEASAGQRLACEDLRFASSQGAARLHHYMPPRSRTVVVPEGLSLMEGVRIGYLKHAGSMVDPADGADSAVVQVDGFFDDPDGLSRFYHSNRQFCPPYE